MTTTFAGFCDALLEDLVTNVPGLRGVLTHRYAAWDPEQQTASVGEKHLAVFPAAEAAEASQPLVTGPGGDMLLQVYRVVYWENVGDETARGIADQDASSDLLTLLEAVRARLYVSANVSGAASLGGAEHVRYIGAGLPERAGSVRWFMVGVQVRTSLVVS